MKSKIRKMQYSKENKKGNCKTSEDIYSILNRILDDVKQGENSLKQTGETFLRDFKGIADEVWQAAESGCKAANRVAQKIRNESHGLQNYAQILKTLVMRHEHAGYTKDQIIDNLAQLVQKEREQREVQKHLMQWRLHGVMEKKKAIDIILTTTFYKRKQLERSFKKWKRISDTNIQTIKLHEANKLNMEESKRQLGEKESIICKLKENIEDLTNKNEVLTLECHRIKLEQHNQETALKKSLMRIICFLNSEVLNILNQNKAKEEISNPGTTPEGKMFSMRKCCSSELGTIKNSIKATEVLIQEIAKEINS